MSQPTRYCLASRTAGLTMIVLFIAISICAGTGVLEAEELLVEGRPNTAANDKRNIPELCVRNTDDASCRSSADRGNGIINVADYGAKCDGITDDAEAINFAIDILRGRLSGHSKAARLTFPGGTCAVNSTINLTGIKSVSALVEGGGTRLLGKTSGFPVVDALDTEFLRVRDLTIVGDSLSSPSIGIQIGRSGVTSKTSADNISLDSISVVGKFSFAALYNLNAETSTFYRLVVANTSENDSSYGIVLDGLNHFNAQSSFVKVSQPVDVPQSFNENVFINVDVRHNGAGVPVWMGQTTRHRWIGSYIAALKGRYGVLLFSQSKADSNSFLDFDVHIETKSVQNSFLLTGPNSEPALPGFKYQDQYSPGSNAIFKLENGVTSGSMPGAQIEVGGQPRGSKVFDKPASWKFSGRALIGTSVNWNLPMRNFSGVIDQAGKVSFHGQMISNPSERKNLNGEDLVLTQESSFVLFTQSQNVQAQKIVLPTASWDNQVARFVNHEAEITSLSFTPPVRGWKNGTTMPAYTGLQIRWDAAASAWYRE